MDKRKSNITGADFLLCDRVQKVRRKAAKSAGNAAFPRARPLLNDRPAAVAA